MELLNRTALITGANQGLGKSIAEHFVRAGAHVLLLARGKELLASAHQSLIPLATAPGQIIDSMQADVSDPRQCADAVSRALDRTGGITIVVNNAGVYGPMGRLEDVDWGEWAKTIEINLFGFVHMCRAALPHLRARRYGKIINLSGGGATAPLPYISAYAASKVALVRLTESLALELRDDRIDINAIAPGALNTRMLDEVLSAGPDKVGADFYKRALQQKEAGGASLDRAAQLAVFLASGRSDGISGKLLSAVWDDWEHLDNLTSDVYTLRRVVPPEKGK